MALRYFGAKVSEISVGIKYSTNSGYLPKFLGFYQNFYIEKVVNFGRL